MGQSYVFSTTNNPSLIYPDIAYVDTNAVVEIIFNRTFQSQVTDFFMESAKRNNILVYSDHVLDEIIDCLQTEILKEEATANGFVPNKSLKMPLYKQYESSSGVNVGPKVSSKFCEVVDLLGAGSNVFYKLESPPAHILRFKTDRYIHHGISPKDAKHLAIAHYHKINNIFTLDGGMTKAPDFNVYGPNRSVTKHSTSGNSPLAFSDVIP
ncbi:hypothetical protein PPYC2_21520 [Paenibacillus polymyxa]|uniref:type II toxin-antitoxin system VapC family toxin n=1 Tax=Paenibacillus polymyxa TaxID=1406 RepID=UPI0008FB40CC|nr:hypothetical protein [Paenibacillus polymyxa]APB77367.1 hypothetical protein PPYC2_21520 [Paenibacillus polymyxa]